MAKQPNVIDGPSDVRAWKDWRATQQGELASYVDGRHVEHLGLVPPGIAATRLGVDGHAPDRLAAVNREVAISILHRLASAGYRYREADLDRDGFQRLRHPDELRVKAATCVDLCIAYACASERAGLASLICLGWRELDPVGHAWIAIDLWRGPERTANPAPELAVYEDARLAEHLRNPRYLVLDVTRVALDYEGQGGQVAHPEQRVATAIDGGPSLLGSQVDRLRIVDIGKERAAGRVPFEPPDQGHRSLIVDRLPQSEAFSDFDDPTRSAALSQLRARRGFAVLHGPSGVGKSTLALEAARPVDGGFGWMLRATDRDTLINSLAQVELERRGARRDNEQLSIEDRRAYARDVLEQLRTTPLPWAVVIDNVITAPDDNFLRWMPRPTPDHGQLVIVTTTHDGWLDIEDRRSHESWSVQAVAPLQTRSDARDELTVAGFPLFITAFDRVAGYLQVPRSEVVDDATPYADGADRLWELAQRALAQRFPEALTLARMAAWSAADDLPRGDLASAAGAAEDHWTHLIGTGLVTAASTGRYRMHRLVGRAIRSADLHLDPGRWTAAIDGALTVADACDIEALRLIEQALIDWEPRDVDNGRRRGELFHDVAARLEPLVGVKQAQAAFSHAKELLPADDHRRLGSCLHALVRLVYQREDVTVDELQLALEDLQRAAFHRQHAVQVAADEHEVTARRLERSATEAYLGLVKVKMGQVLLRTEGLPSEQIRDAVALIEEGSREVKRSYLTRLEITNGDETEPLVVRGRFNLAPVSLANAKLPNISAEQRKQHLDEAERTYRQVGRIRQSMTTVPGAHLAACLHGPAIVDYYRAVLLPPELLLDDPDEARGGVPPARAWHLRSERLVAAESSVQVGLDRRRLIADTDDDEDVQKSLKLQLKVSLLRNLWCRAYPRSDAPASLRGQLQLADGVLGDLVPEIAPELRSLLSWAGH